MGKLDGSIDLFPELSSSKRDSSDDYESDDYADDTLESRYTDTEIARIHDIMDSLDEDRSKSVKPFFYKWPESRHDDHSTECSKTATTPVEVDKACSVIPGKTGIRSDRYPRAWMLKDKEINKLFTRKPFLIKILNFIHDYNRSYTDGQIGMMIDDANKYKKYRSKKFQDIFRKTGYTPSTFIVNKQFYQRMSIETGVPVRTCQRYVRSLAQINVIRRVGKNSDGNALFIDGYFRQVHIGEKSLRRKEPFLREKSTARKLLGKLLEVGKHY